MKNGGGKKKNGNELREVGFGFFSQNWHFLSNVGQEYYFFVIMRKIRRKDSILLTKLRGFRTLWSFKYAFDPLFERKKSSRDSKP